MEWYRDQVIASTHQDSQGEKYDLDFLKDLYKSMKNKKIPMGKDHDLSQGYSGFLENPTIEEDPVNDGEYYLKADVYCENEELSNILKGISFSISIGIKSNVENPEVGIFLPYPHYNDENKIDSLLEIEAPIEAGKWVKKELDPAEIALIASFVYFVLKPFWQKYFDKKIAPHLGKILDSPNLDKSVKYDFGIKCGDTNGNDFHIYFGSNKKDLSSLRPYLIKSGIEKVQNFIETDKKAQEIGIAMARLNYDKTLKSYSISGIEYKNGEYVNF